MSSNIKNLLKENTILTNFINNKINNYNEPQRIGTPKGYQIGYSKTKYTASLLLMTKFKKKEIAKFLGISYGTIRNWATEESFIKLINDQANEVAILISDYIKDTLVSYSKNVIDCLNNSKNPKKLNSPEMNDLHLYGEVIFVKITEYLCRFMEHLNNNNNNNPSPYITNLEYLGIYLYNLVMRDPFDKKDDKKIMHTLINKSNAIIKKDTFIDIKDRSYLMFYLELMLFYISEE